jgi:flagellar protein FliL
MNTTTMKGNERGKERMSKRTIIITSAIVLITLIVVSTFFILAFKVDLKKKFASPTAHAEKVQELSIDTTELTTNLSSDNYVVIRLNLLANNKHAKSEIEMRMAEIKEIIILTLSNYKDKDFKGSDALVGLTDELKQQFNGMLKAGEVDRVMLTEFKLR